MSGTFEKIDQLNQKIRDQERVIQTLQESINQIHTENIALRQSLLDQKDNQFKEQLRPLSNKIKHFYCDKVTKKEFNKEILSINELITLLQEIFMYTEYIKEKKSPERGRSKSPAFTFGNIDDFSFDNNLTLKMSSLESTQTNLSDDNSDNSNEKTHKMINFQTPQPKKNKKSKKNFDFFSLFRRKSDSPVNFE